MKKSMDLMEEFIRYGVLWASQMDQINERLELMDYKMNEVLDNVTKK